MNAKRVALGMAPYSLVTFPAAVVWHVVLFESQYQSFGYFEGEPNFVLGLLSISFASVIAVRAVCDGEPWRQRCEARAGVCVDHGGILQDGPPARFCRKANHHRGTALCHDGDVLSCVAVWIVWSVSWLDPQRTEAGGL